MEVKYDNNVPLRRHDVMYLHTGSVLLVLETITSVSCGTSLYPQTPLHDVMRGSHLVATFETFICVYLIVYDADQPLF